MPASAKFWSKRKKAAFDRPYRALEPQGIAIILSRKNDISFCIKRDKSHEARQEDALSGNQKSRWAEQFRLPAARTALALLIAASIGSAVTPSFAQTVPAPDAQAVPIPKPAPKRRDTPISAFEAQKGPGRTGATTVPP